MEFTRSNRLAALGLSLRSRPPQRRAMRGFPVHIPVYRICICACIPHAPLRRPLPNTCYAPAGPRLNFSLINFRCPLHNNIIIIIMRVILSCAMHLINYTMSCIVRNCAVYAVPYYVVGKFSCIIIIL